MSERKLRLAGSKIKEHYKADSMREGRLQSCGVGQERELEVQKLGLQRDV